MANLDGHTMLNEWRRVFYVDFSGAANAAMAAALFVFWVADILWFRGLST